MRPLLATLAAAAALGSFCLSPPSAIADHSPPNFLFIAIDDLSDWVSCLQGHPQAQTPHMDRLAQRGVNFTNAHCQAPICQPSRTSLLTGTYPFSNGVYDVEQDMRAAPLVKDAVTIPEYFRDHGYRTLAAGKIFHRGQEEEGMWHENGPRYGWAWMRDIIGPEGISGLPEPSIFDFGPVPFATEEMNDSRIVDWVIDQLKQPHDQPFFLAAGLVTPHLPLFTPQEFYDQFPLDSTSLPATLPGDLEDLPPMGRKFTRYFDTTPMNHADITRLGLWTKAVASYLACSAFTDHCVGRLLDALDQSPYADNTIVVLWSDHGFHIGEKMHWEKRSLWEESTRVPLIIAGPNISAGTPSPRTVELVDLYPTLLELAQLPEKPGLEGQSLVPLLKDPTHPWPQPALTTQMPGNHAVRTERWRYIQYANGDTELYDHSNDPHEFYNLADKPEHAATIKKLQTHLPKTEVPSGPRLPQQRYTQDFDWTQP
ncbi:MAG: sulfatase [Verrucomicrobiota bacterium]